MRDIPANDSDSRMNVLFLNAGRRCELMELFKAALERRGGGLVCASDISELAPALYKADRKALLPRSSAPEFPKALAELCEKEGVSLLVPTIDPDLEALDKRRDEIARLCPGLRLLLSPSFAIAAARDKRESKRLFARLGAEVPQDADPLDPALTFPIFVKPPDGSSGIGARSIDCAADLKAALAKDPSLMVERVVGGPEYTVDVLCDFEGKALLAVPRRRLKVRGGEVVQGVIEMREGLISLAKRLAEGFRVQGPVTVQFRMPEEGRFVAMELNARMGGGLPLAVAAGADWPGVILDLAAGRSPNLRLQIRDGLCMSRYDSSVFVMPGELQAPASAPPRLGGRKELLEGVKAFVFDLDDTLYPERDFVYSGYRAVAEAVWRDYGVEIEACLRALFESGRRGDLFTEALRSAGLDCQQDYVMSLVGVYRGHAPLIKPCADYEVVRLLRSSGFKTGLISDGWLSVQSNKVAALGIERDFDSLILTDSLGGQEFWKPSPAPFKKALEDIGLSPEQAVYVGDNPAKDFLGARRAGMKSLRIRRPGGEHSKSEASGPDSAPDAEISSLSEMAALLRLSGKT